MGKIFFDTEFTGLHQNTTLISIGMISEDECTFYAEFNDYNQNQIDSWIQTNVIEQLRFQPPREDEDEHYIISRDKNNIPPSNIFNGYSMELRGNTPTIKTELDRWLKQFGRVELWSDCLAYDWVLFCQLWGHALNIPRNVYYIPMDICPLFRSKGVNPSINREKFADMQGVAEKHNSLWKAKVIKACYEKII